MKKTNFVMGIVASILLIIYHISWLVGAIGAGDDSGQGAIAFVSLILAFVLLWLTYRARTTQAVSNGVWTIILGVVCGFFPVSVVILILFFRYYIDPIMIATFGSLCSFAIIARGIMTLKSRKNPYELDDFDKESVVREKNAGNITGAVLALLGGLANALIGIFTLIEMFEADLFSSSKHMMPDITVFYIFILIFSLVGAVVLLFNRFQGGVLLITCSAIALLLSLISAFVSVDEIGIILIIAQLLVLTVGILGIRGYQKTIKPKPEQSRQ